jgi:hypothetical protein
MANSVIVSALPKCNFCGDTARYDLRTLFGSWANFCEKCRLDVAIHGNTLGTGQGQYLALEGEELPEHITNPYPSESD